MDRSTKIILLAIAAGLWANAAVYVVRPARADSWTLNSINQTLDSIAVSIGHIETGRCPNHKLC